MKTEYRGLWRRTAQPIADNKTEAGRAQNRRVVVSTKAQAETIRMKT